MKKKITTLVLCLLLVFIWVPGTVQAYESGMMSYADNDYYKLVAFLNLPSNVPGKTNGQCISSLYDPTSPATWNGVTWTGVDTVFHVKTIHWPYLELDGSLDASGFTSMTNLGIYNNGIDSLNVAGDTLLAHLFCQSNQLAALDVTTLPALYNLDLSDNAGISAINLASNTHLFNVACSNTGLTSLDLSQHSELRYLSCNNCKIESLDISGIENFVELQATGNPLTHIRGYFFVTDEDIRTTGNGFLDIGYINDFDYFNLLARPDTGASFIDWTIGPFVWNTDAAGQLGFCPEADLVANFSSVLNLVVDPGSSTIYKGGQIKVTTNIPGGEWIYDPVYFSVNMTDPLNPLFIGLKVGQSRITYNAPDEQTDFVDVTVLAPVNPITGEDNHLPAALLLIVAASAAIGMILIKRRNHRQSV